MVPFRNCPWWTNTQKRPYRLSTTQGSYSSTKLPGRGLEVIWTLQKSFHLLQVASCQRQTWFFWMPYSNKCQTPRDFTNTLCFFHVIVPLKQMVQSIVLALSPLRPLPSLSWIGFILHEQNTLFYCSTYRYGSKLGASTLALLQPRPCASLCRLLGKYFVLLCLCLVFKVFVVLSIFDVFLVFSSVVFKVL